MKRTKKKQRKQKATTSSRLSEQKRIEAFVNQNWLTIAAIAWDGYQKDGRGFLLLDALPPRRTRYMTVHPGASTEESLPVGIQAFAKAIETYDPQKEVLLVFYGAAFSGVHMAREAQNPPPPEAYTRYHQKNPVISIAPQDAKALSDIINPYAGLLMGLDKTTCHPLSTLPHPKDKIKHALLQFAKTVDDGKVLVDVGMMYAYLGLFLPEEQLTTKTQQEWKDIVAKELLTLHNEFVSYVETHNPHHFKAS